MLQSQAVRSHKNLHHPKVKPPNMPTFKKSLLPLTKTWVELEIGLIKDQPFLEGFTMHYSDTMLAVLTLGPIPGAKLKLIPGQEFYRSARQQTAPDLRDSICVAYPTHSGEEVYKVAIDNVAMSEQYLVDRIYNTLRDRLFRFTDPQRLAALIKSNPYGEP